MISVIMLTYNRERLVSRAIESILNQTSCDFLPCQQKFLAQICTR